MEDDHHRLVVYLSLLDRFFFASVIWGFESERVVLYERILLLKVNVGASRDSLFSAHSGAPVRWLAMTRFATPVAV